MKYAEFDQNRLALNVALAIKTPVSETFNILQDRKSSDVHNCLECSHNITWQEIFLCSFQACLILRFCKRDRICASVPCDDLKQCLRLAGGESRSNSYTQIICLCM